ncbi:MAG: BMP family ABC transporter substrate-binding protein [Ruminiclostridium sp.]
MKFSDRLKAGAVALIMLFVAGCDGGEPEESTSETLETVVVTDESGAPVTDESGNPVTEPVEEEKIVYKVGFLYNNEVSKGATNKIFENARQQIEKNLAIETCYIEGALVADVPEAVNALKEEGCNIIVSCSPRFSNSISKEAKAATDTYFFNFGGGSSGGNMSGFGGKLYQTAAVCGIAAAYNTDTNVIGVIADPSEYNTYGVVNGFTLGATEIWGVKTDVRLNWVWSDDNGKIKEAVDDLVSQGCDVIMSYTSTDYPIEYCNELGVKVIANSCDIPELAPENYLTGFFFNFSTYLVDEIRSIQNDVYISGVSNGDIATGGARLINFSPNCREGTDTISNKFYEYVKSGKASVFSGEIKDRDNNIMVEKGQTMTFDNILKIDWLVQGIRSVGNFTHVTQDPVPGNLEIKK